MYTSLCIARVFDDHRSCQKWINYITNIKAESKRYHWIQKIPVLDFKLGTIDNRKDYMYLQTWGEFLLCHFFFWIKTGIRDFLLDIYFAYNQYIVHLFFLFFPLTIKDKTKISLTIKILPLGQGSFTRKVRTIFTLRLS
jgi:hypothetical protein